MRKFIGIDRWQLVCPYIELLQLAKTHGLELYEVVQKKDHIIVCTPLYQRVIVRRFFSDARLLHTHGIIGFLIRNMKRPSRCCSFILFFVIWYCLSQFTFVIEIRGDSTLKKTEIQSFLLQEYGELPVFSLDETRVEHQLEQAFNSLAWIETVKEGSCLKIRFTTQKSIEKETLINQDLIAQRDGIIAGFDLQSGNKCVQVNDAVKKGDVLVSSMLLDSFQKEKSVYVKGRVFAYTWETIEVSCKKDAFPQPLQFFRLLLNAREKVSEDFLKDDRIEKENILQFEEKAGTIRMKIHYTIYRDISSPV